MDAASPAPPPLRRWSARLLGAACVVHVTMGIPEELAPGLNARVTAPVRDWLDDHGYNPWHFVFGGVRGINKRRNIALRYTGITADGERVVLHEAPPGLTGPSVRLFDHMPTTATIKNLGLQEGGELMFRRDDPRWLEELDTVRGLARVRRSVLGFCDSATLNGGRDLQAVELDLFSAGISYTVGVQYGRAARALRADCERGTVEHLHGEAPDRPDWPGMKWKAVP